MLLFSSSLFPVITLSGEVSLYANTLFVPWLYLLSSFVQSAVKSALFSSQCFVFPCHLIIIVCPSPYHPVYVDIILTYCVSKPCHGSVDILKTDESLGSVFHSYISFGIHKLHRSGPKSKFLNLFLIPLHRPFDFFDELSSQSPIPFHLNQILPSVHCLQQPPFQAKFSQLQKLRPCRIAALGDLRPRR